MSSRPRAERIAKNESRFREINERLEGGLRRVAPGADQLEFICECGSSSCTELIRLTLAEYEAVRTDSRRFAVVPGHAIPAVERVVASEGRYDVVEKVGGAAALTDAADDRVPGPAGRRSDDPTP